MQRSFDGEAAAAAKSPAGIAHMKNSGMLRIDCTHAKRRATGIERITQELFNARVLSDIPSSNFESPKGRFAVFVSQMIGLPLHVLLRRHDVFIFPGFPPSPIVSLTAKRCVMYVHDIFLLTRRNDLNFAARVYLAPLFAFAVRHLKYFLVNSENTARALRNVCRSDAKIMLYRPYIRNVFDLSVGDRNERTSEPAVLRVAAIGTVEPRKNYLAAANVCAALARLRGVTVEFHVIGRDGWGEEWSRLAKLPNVVLHGTLSDEEVRDVIEAADIFICSSHDEGLGLPLLEVQYAGLPTVAPDRNIFREVLGDSGIYIDPRDPTTASNLIMKACSGPKWRQRHAGAALANVKRWNTLASGDRSQVLAFLRQLLAQSCGLH